MGSKRNQISKIKGRLKGGIGFGVDAEGRDSHHTVFRRSRKLRRKWNDSEPQAATAKGRFVPRDLCLARKVKGKKAKSWLVTRGSSEDRRRKPEGCRLGSGGRQ